MDIVFYDFDFNRLGDFPRPVSVNLEKCYCGFGCGELHFGIDEKEIIDVLENNEYLFFKAKDSWAIVTGWQLGEDIAVYGRTPEWLLTKRGVLPISYVNTSAEVIAREMVASIPDFVALGELSNLGEEMDYTTEDVKSLYDAVCEVLASQALGFEVNPDMEAKRFVFRVYEGAVGTCVFSASNRTAYNMEYSVERQNMATNSGWYERRYKNMGGWDAQQNMPSVSDNQAGNAYTFYKITSDDYEVDGDRVSMFGIWCRKGMYLYCDNPEGKWKITETQPNTIWLYISDTTKSGIKRWDAVLGGIKTEEEATTEISQLKQQRSIDCDTYRYEYGRDYLLGDMVTVQPEFGSFKTAQQKRVTSVSLYYDINGSGVIPTLTEE